jgi:hypothetical protein
MELRKWAGTEPCASLPRTAGWELPVPFPNQDAGVGVLRQFRKITLDVDGVEAAAPSSAVFERQRMVSGKQRLLIAAIPGRPTLFRELARCLAAPLFLLYVLHTPRGEGAPGRYQSPELDSQQVDNFLADFAPYLAGDARHDTWVHSALDGRTLIWDRHDLIFAEGEPLEDMTSILLAAAYEIGTVSSAGAVPHIHYYRSEFDADAAAVLARFEWARVEPRAGGRTIVGGKVRFAATRRRPTSTHSGRRLPPGRIVCILGCRARLALVKRQLPGDSL